MTDEQENTPPTNAPDNESEASSPELDHLEETIDDAKDAAGQALPDPDKR